MTDRVQIVGLFYGMAGDLAKVNYTWPRAVQISRERYARAKATMDARACAVERGARMDGVDPEVVVPRRDFVLGTLYSKCVCLLVFVCEHLGGFW